VSRAVSRHPEREGQSERSEGSALDVEALRAREFPWIATEGIVYLNAASTGPQPARTVERLKEWAELRGSMHKIDFELQFGTLRRSRELCARLIGAKPTEIALATNTGFGINVAARALPLSIHGWAPRTIAASSSAASRWPTSCWTKTR
jgi:selenocysteine lyase/cysteine desulfurase